MSGVLRSVEPAAIEDALVGPEHLGDTDHVHAPRRPWWWMAVAVVLLAGAGLRMVNITDPMFEFFPTRQYMSLDLAWKYDMAWGGAAEDGDREAAEIRQETEPPVMEVATAAIWRVMGARPLWVPRLLTIAVWSFGGVVLALLLRRLRVSPIGVVTGVVVWTFVPFVVQATRVFQPDPLMVTTILLAVLMLVVDDDRRTTKSLVLAGLAAGFAVFVKVPALFFIVAAFVGLTWFGRGARALVSGRTLVFAALTVPLAVAYNVLGLVVLDFLDGKEGNFVFPRMLTTADFWNRWWSLAFVTFSTGLIVLAAVGIGFARGRARVLGLSLFAGYLSYGVVFTWNYSTHHYYHLPLVMVIAIGTALAGSEVEDLVRRRRGDLLSVGVATVALITLASGWTFSLWRFVPPDASATAVATHAVASARVGEATGHTDRAIVLVEHYGYPLAFYGSVRGVPWPRSDDLVFQAARGDAPMSVDERFRDLADRSDAEYFIVMDGDEWERQPELRSFLESQFPTVAEGPGFLVFDLR